MESSIIRGEEVSTQPRTFDEVINTFIENVCNVIRPIGDQAITAAWQQFMAVYSQHLEDPNQKAVQDQLISLKSIVAGKFEGTWKVSIVKKRRLGKLLSRLTDANIAMAKLLNPQAPIFTLSRDTLAHLVQFLSSKDAINLKRTCHRMHSLFGRTANLRPNLTDTVWLKKDSNLSSFIRDERVMKSVVVSCGLAVLKGNIIRIFSPFYDQVINSIVLPKTEDDKDAVYKMIALSNKQLLVVSHYARVFDVDANGSCKLVSEYLLKRPPGVQIILDKFESIAVTDNGYFVCHGSYNGLFGYVLIWDMEDQFQFKKSQKFYLHTEYIHKIRAVGNMIACQADGDTVNACEIFVYRARRTVHNELKLEDMSNRNILQPLNLDLRRVDLAKVDFPDFEMVKNETTIYIIYAVPSQIDPSVTVCVRKFREDDPYSFVEDDLDAWPYFECTVTILDDHRMAVQGRVNRKYDKAVRIYSNNNDEGNYKLTHALDLSKFVRRGVTYAHALPNGGMLFNGGNGSLLLCPGTLFSPTYQEKAKAQGFHCYDNNDTKETELSQQYRSFSIGSL